MSEKNEHDDGNPEIDIQRRSLISGSLTLLGTASAGLLTGCGGSSGGGSGGGSAAAPSIELVSSQPANGATAVSNATSVTLTFSAAVTVGAGAITITGPSGAVSTTMTTNGAVVTLVPANPLSPGDKYSVS